MIDRIQIKGFKSIREMDLELRPLNVLIGANGSGKSNFLELFEFLRFSFDAGFDTYLAERGGAERFLYFGSKVTQTISAVLYSDGEPYEAEWTPAPGNKLRFSGDNRLKEMVKSYKVYHFNDTTDTAKIRRMGNLHDNDSLHADGGNLATFLYMLREDKNPYYQIVVRAIRLAVPFFEDFVLEPHDSETIILKWKEKGRIEPLSADYLSDGTLRYMTLATLLLQPMLPPLILIDEPEIGLHPFAVTYLGGMLQSAAVKTQVMVAAQSVNFINKFAPEEIVVVDRLDNQSTFRHITSDEMIIWPDEYGLGELWERAYMGGTPQH